MDCETDLTLTVDRVATNSCQVGIGVGVDSKSEMDPDPSSKPVRADSTKSSFKSSNSMGGSTGFAFCHIANLEAGCGGVNHCEGCWGRTGYYGGCGGGGGADCCDAEGGIGC